MAPDEGWLIAIHSSLARMRAWNGEIEAAERELKKAQDNYAVSRTWKGAASGKIAFSYAHSIFWASFTLIGGGAAPGA